jgi:ParB family transcriptional regulator, chromosome partitioning protein
MEKRGLGRGLAALISEAGNEVEDGQIREIPIHAISPNPYQPRTNFDPEKMAELVDSVRQHGILQPLLVRQTGLERYELVAGERRFRAAQAAGLTTVPVIIKDFTDQEQLEIAIVENLQREDIGPVETARAFRRLMDEFSMTQEVVAQRTGKARSTVTNLVRLLTLPEEVLDSLEHEEITEGHAKALLTLHEGWRQAMLWQQVVSKHMTVRETEKRAKQLQEEVDSLPTLPQPVVKPQRSYEPSSHTGHADPNFADVADRLQQSLGTKVTLRQHTNGAGRIEIEFYSAQELERLIEFLVREN